MAKPAWSPRARRAKRDESALWRAYHEFHFRCDTLRVQKLLARVELVRMVARVPGDIVDAGTFKGVSALQFAHALDTFRPTGRGRVLAFDTFAYAMPHLKAHERGVARRLMAGYEPDAYEKLRAAIEDLGLAGRVAVIKGDIVRTLPRYLKENPGLRIALLHLDLDAYAPTLAVLKAAWPRITRGGMVAFDEYGQAPWGESDAADEFFKGLVGRPPRLRTLEWGESPTAYCVKEA